MKNIVHSTILFLAVMLCIGSCQPKKEKEGTNESKPRQDFTFSGIVTSTKGSPIIGAMVSINGKETRTEKTGEFKLATDSSSRFVVVIKRRGYGTLSKIFTTPVRDYHYKMQKAFTKVIDPKKDNTIKDMLSEKECVGCGFKNLAFDAEYKRIPMVYNAEGKLVDFGWTPGLKSVFDQLSGPPLCNPGATVMLPANTIVTAGGQPVKDSVTISISTIDLQSPDGMPGDYTYEFENQRGAMQSMGAVSIELYNGRGEEMYNIDKNAKVKPRLSVPADPLKLKFNKSIPETIPVLYYDERSGVWKQENKQTAHLNNKTKSYELEVHHFSSINLDFFTDPTCIRFRQVPLSSPGTPGGMISPFRIYAMTAGANFTTHYGTEDPAGCFARPDGTNLHVLYNAPPPTTDVAIVITNDSASPNAFFGIAVIQTGASASPASLTGCPATLCDETDPATCQPFSPNCVYLPLTLHTENAILVLKQNATFDLKWVFQTAPPTDASNAYQYYFQYKEDAAPATSWIRYPVGSSYLPGLYDTTHPINAASIPAITGLGASKIKLMIHDITGGSSVDVESNPVGF